MSEVVSQASPLNVDVEVAVATVAVGSDQRPQQQADNTATTAAPAAAEEGGGEIDAGPNFAGAESLALSRQRALDTTGVAFFMVLAFAAGMSLVFLLSDLLNRKGVHPITAGVFLLSTTYCVAIWKRHQARPNELGGASSAGGTSGRPNFLLTSEAREALLTYFIFTHPTAATGSNDDDDESCDDKDDERRASQPQQLKQKQHQCRHGKKRLPRGTDVLNALDSSTGSNCSSRRRWGSDHTEEGGLGNGNEDGDGWQDDDVGTDSTPSNTPADSPTPSRGNDDDAASGDPVTVASANAVASVGREMLEENHEDEEQPRFGGNRQAAGGNRDQLWRSDPASSYRPDRVVVTTTISPTVPAAGVGDEVATHAGQADDDTDEAPPTVTTETAFKEEVRDTSNKKAEEKTVGGRPDSQSGKWATDVACIVCFGEYADGDRLCRLPCGHVYHAECINEWLDRARIPSCPLCKTNLVLALCPTNHNGGAAARGNGSGGGGGGGSGGGGTAGSPAIASDAREVELTGENAV